MIKIAIVGCGRVSGHHLRAIAATPGAGAVAVCDLLADKAKTYAKEFGVPWFTNYHDMLRQVPEADVVAVITPSGMHFEHATEILEGYGKHLIVEKPTFMRPAQLDEAYDLAERLGVTIFPVFQNRYNKAVRRLKVALDSGELGELRVASVRVRWCRPQRYYDLSDWRGTFSHDGGVLTNQSIHHIDLLRYLCGEVDKVNATMRTLGADIEVEDTVVATLAYASGAVGVLEATTAARPDDYEASFSVVGSEGLAQLGGLAVNELQIFTPDPDACAAHSEDIPDAYGFGHYALYADVVASLRDGAAPAVNRDDCMKTIKLLHAFYRSDEAGTWVEVDSEDQSSRLGRADDKLSGLYRTPKPARVAT